MTDMMKLRVAIFLLIASVFLVNSVPAPAQDTKAQESRKARLEKEIALLNSQLKENSSKSSTAMNRLTLVRKKISNRQELVKESDREIASISREIELREEQLALLQGRLDTLSSHYSRMVRGAYKTRDPKVWYMYILASDDLSQAFRRIGYLRDLSAEMARQAEKIRQTRAEIDLENEKLRVMQAQARELRAQRQQEVTSLRKEESQSDELVRQLKKDRNRYQKDLAAKQKQVQDLNREIERIIREATRGTSKGKKPEVDYTLDAEFSKNKGRLPWPAEGVVIEKYGQNYSPVYKNVKLPFNNGVTMAVASSAPVKAVFDGVVKQIVIMPGYNRCVLVQHGNYFTFYCKLDQVNVKAGDKVKTGDLIGHTSAGGDSQVHFQVWKGTAPQNPENWLR